MKRRYELEPPPVVSGPEAPLGRFQTLVRLYGSADPRSLGLMRVALGALLAVDVALKFPDAAAHLSNSGWLPNHFALFRPMSEHLFSVYLAFGSPREVDVLLGLHLLVCLLLMVGYRTKLMQLLALLLTTSLNSRNIMIENGGSVVLNILLVWTAFLPLGRRFSVDALRVALRARKETTQAALNQRLDPPREVTPVVSLAVTALLLQWAIIYAFNAVQKNGAPWRDGTAVYYFLQQDRLVTWFGAWLRGALPLGGMKLLTFAALLIEGSLPLLLLSPWRPRLTRMLAFGLALLLHVGIDSVLQLGSFSWALLVAFLAFVPYEAWELLRRYFSARRTPCVLHFEPESGASLGLCRLVKRLDALGFVTFRALDAASPKKAERSLCVSIDGQKSMSGWAALVAIADALWFGSRPLRLLAPLLRRRVERRLAELATTPEELDLDLGLEHLPAQADARSAEVSEARQFWQRLWANFRETGVAFLMVVCATQVLIENQVVPSALKPLGRPRLFETVITYPRIFQGWSMFAPAPPDRDGRLVIDGRTRDGRHFDPLTGREPVFEVHPRGAPRTNLSWGYFHVRIALDRFKPYWSGVRDFVMNHHKLTGRLDDELASFEAYYVSETFPPPGAAKRPAQRSLLFSSTTLPGDTAPPPRTKGKAGKQAVPRAQ
jgi:hypothetical protein